MRVTATLQTLSEIRTILLPHGFWEPVELKNVRAPRAPPSSVRWMADADDGQVIDLDAEQDPRRMPTAYRYPWPQERFRYHSDEPEQQPVPSEQPKVEQLDNGLLLVIEDPDPWAHATEPVFWMD